MSVLKEFNELNPKALAVFLLCFVVACATLGFITHSILTPINTIKSDKTQNCTCEQKDEPRTATDGKSVDKEEERSFSPGGDVLCGPGRIDGAF